jgi:sigma-B regulation protein RsbU (phosphoserine phosphatase)
MFVTAFMGYLDIPTGKFTCVNAGHNPPLIRHGGVFDWLKIKRGLVLAGMEGMRYKEEEINFEPGDMLYLYTDGVTEAVNPEQEFFSEPRLLEAVVVQQEPYNLQDFAVSIKQEIDAFARNAEQADDITMLALRYMGNAEWKELKIEATLENLNMVLDFVHDELEKTNCSPKTQSQINIVVEEIFVNIVRYAYTPIQGTAFIRIVIVGDELRLEFEDMGQPYDPLDKPDPDITADAKDRPIGGLGIFMVKKIMDKVEYRYKDNKNLLMLTKKLT